MACAKIKFAGIGNLKNKAFLKKTMRLFFALTIALMLMAPAPAPAQQLPAPDAGQERVSLEAASITHSSQADTYTATGNVVVTRGNQSFTADMAEYDRANNVLTAFGDVVVKAGDDILTGEQIRFELDGQTGEVINGAIYLRANELTIKGALIQKTGPDTFSLERGSITACPGEKPDWKITARKVRVRVEGYGTAQSATLWLRDIPVFYLPWFAFPAKTKRTTGLLVPEAGQSSRKGLSFNQPLFLAPQQHWDITLYNHYMERRGLQAAAEFRHAADENSRIHLLGAFLQDKEIDDGLLDNSIEYGYALDPWLRENRDRYWLVGKLDRDFENGVKLRADIDIVSDQDYLREFGSGAFGFDATNRNLSQTFGRDIDDFDVPVRENRLHGHKAWQTFELGGDLLWRDAVIARRHNQQDVTLQNLPRILIGKTQQQILPGIFSPLLFGFNADATHLFRKDASTALRADFSPRIDAPFFAGPFIHARPWIGLRQTFWRMGSMEGLAPGSKESFERTLYEAGIDLSTELARVYGQSAPGAGRARHVLIPRLEWAYIPEKDQSALPFFDDADRIEAANTLRWSLAQSLTTKSAPADENAPASYARILWFELAQYLDINEATQDNPALFETPGSRRPLSPVEARLELVPAQGLSIGGEGHLAVYGQGFVYSAIGLGITRQNFSFQTGYNLVRHHAESAFARLWLPIQEKWEIAAFMEQDISNHSRVRQDLAVTYFGPCWSVSLAWADEPGEQEISLKISLTGLGSIGTRAAPF